MRILLIGGNGFIGGYTVPALLERGHSVCVFHRGNSPVPPGATEIHGNRNQLSSHAAELKRFAPDVVVDFVLSSGPQAEELIEAFRESAARIVMLSSIDVYRAVAIAQGADPGPLQPVPLTEDSELRREKETYTPELTRAMRQIFSWVTDDYDKIPAERVLLDVTKLQGTILRLPFVYGPGDPLHRLYGIAKRMADDRKRIIIAENVAGWRGPRGYVENVAAAIALAATDERASGRVYNVCEQPSYSELAWAEKIASVMNWTGEFVTLPVEHTPPHLRRPGNMAQHWAASSERIRTELNFTDPIPVDEAIRRTVSWELANPPSLPFLAPIDYAAEDVAIVL